MQPYSLPATAHTGSLCFNARDLTAREYHYVDKKVMAIIILPMMTLWGSVHQSLTVISDRSPAYLITFVIQTYLTARFIQFSKAIAGAYSPAKSPHMGNICFAGITASIGKHWKRHLASNGKRVKSLDFKTAESPSSFLGGTGALFPFVHANPHQLNHALFCIRIY